MTTVNPASAKFPALELGQKLGEKLTELKAPAVEFGKNITESLFDSEKSVVAMGAKFGEHIADRNIKKYDEAVELYYSITGNEEAKEKALNASDFNKITTAGMFKNVANTVAIGSKIANWVKDLF